MEIGLVRKGLDDSRRRKKWVVLMAALGLSSYGVYRACQSPAVATKRQKLVKVFGAFVSVAEAVSDSAEVVGVLSKDLKEFLQSDSDEIPNSLRQVSKIARSDEFSGLVARLTGALTAGVLRGYRAEMGGAGGEGDDDGSSSFIDQVMDRMFSKAGSGFVSIVAGSFARNLVMGFYASDQGNPVEDAPWWVNVARSHHGKAVIGDCVQIFASTAVTVYLEKTMHINTYDEMLAGLTNPRHEARVKEMLISVCNGAVETLIKTSHQVLTDTDFDKNHSSSGSFYSAIDQCPSPKQIASGLEVISSALNRRSKKGSGEEKGWMSKVSSTLSVPSNRRLVLDVTGRVTFETVRSFLSLLLEKVFEASRRSVEIVGEGVVDRGVEAVRYVRVKTSVVATICISLWLHILNSPWLFVPARGVEYV